MPKPLITLDLDYTLWHTQAVLQRAEQAMYAWLAQHVPSVTQLYTQEALNTYRVHMAQSRPSLAWQPSALRRYVLRLVLLQTGMPKHTIESVAEQAFQVFYRERSRLELFAGGEAVLAELSQKNCLIALTNGNADLSLIGIAHYFQGSFNAEQVGAAKPNPAMFLAALQHAGATVETSIHVGDQPVDDIQAAQQVGMKTIWANYAQAIWPQGLPPADLEITDIRQLPQAIQQLRALG